MDKSRIGLVYKTPRATRERQDTSLREAGAEWIVEIGVRGQRPNSWRDLSAAVQEGDTVFVYALCLVPTKRGDDALSPSAQVSEFLIEMHEMGAVVVETYTGRKSSDKKQRRAMVADAHKALRRGSRALPGEGIERGRPKLKWSPEVVAEAKRVWFSRDYVSNVAAAKYLPKGITAKRAWIMFGKSGRPYRTRKR